MKNTINEIIAEARSQLANAESQGYYEIVVDEAFYRITEAASKPRVKVIHSVINEQDLYHCAQCGRPVAIDHKYCVMCGELEPTPVILEGGQQ